MDRLQLEEGDTSAATPRRLSSTTLDVDAKTPSKADSKDEEYGRATIEPVSKEEDFDWETCPENPRNWTWGRKWTATSIISYYTFVTPLASSMMAPGLLQVAQVYHIRSELVVAMTLSIFQLSFAIGPLVIAPISEMYGRTWVYHISNILFMAFNLGCAFSPTAGALVAFRFLSGMAGSAPVVCGGGSISDMFSEKDRASAMAVYTLGPLLGPVLGPIAGGWVAQSIGPKYVFIIIAGLCMIASLVGIPLLRETYGPLIRMRLDQARTGSTKSHSRFRPPGLGGSQSPSQYLWDNLSRPMILLTRSFLCFILSLYMAFLYGIYYLMFATFANFFKETYGFGAGIGGLCYLGLGVGFFAATLFGARLGNGLYAKLSKANGGVGKPEMRIPALIIGSFFVPVGVFWYGWSAQAKIHWIMPIIGTAIFGFGLMTTFLPIQLYLVDSFKYAASALGAAGVFRCLLGFAFPLFGQQMYNTLGLGGGNSLLAGLGIVLGIPFPIWIYYYGERMRMKSSLTR
ncbi:multidrug resistance protein 4 [Pluteus cervinus]|uniref:Multidrug resistance protein 4 n=1 Tax=Pluteus cervinus TaxID=181527 RepID=A0ACD3BDT9_9AGAR|nr:multidrug resistance protein 4 [Pluteus cervinus]